MLHNYINLGDTSLNYYRNMGKSEERVASNMASLPRPPPRGARGDSSPRLQVAFGRELVANRMDGGELGGGHRFAAAAGAVQRQPPRLAG